MESFEIRSADHNSCIRFFDREQFDDSKQIDYFSVRVINKNLEASVRVYALMPYGSMHIFESIESDWKNFRGPLEWTSLEHEFSLTVTHDGLGHFEVVVDLRSGLHTDDWFVNSRVIVETAQLTKIATDARKFFGKVKRTF